MTLSQPGGSLEQLCRSARGELLLVAPFIKLRVFEHLLQCVDPDVSIVCVTRWRPQEIVAGVSDLDIWPHFRGHANRKLHLRHDLHAKLYRADDKYLIGSANLTATALGFTTTPNLELLVEVSSSEQSVVDFEDELWRATVEVDEDTYATMRTAVDAFTPVPQVKPPATSSSDDSLRKETLINMALWVPSTRQPADLFLAYRGRDDDLSPAVAEAAHRDLSVLGVPPGLNDYGFRRVVAALLLQTPVAAAVDRYVAVRERRFGNIADLLAELTSSQDDAGRSWQTLFRWFMYFTPDRFAYRRPGYSELIARNADAG